jgi:hypothetical protein
LEKLEERVSFNFLFLSLTFVIRDIIIQKDTCDNWRQ